MKNLCSIQRSFFLFSTVLAGQVMTRMARDWLGGPGPRPSASNTCMIVTGIYVFVMVAQLILQGVGGSTQCFGGRERYNQDTETFMIECPDGSWEEQTTTYTTTNLINGIISLIFWLFMLIVVCRTREAMRKKYNIAPGGCGGCEDCCCSCWCGCCTVSSAYLGRHDDGLYILLTHRSSSTAYNRSSKWRVIPMTTTNTMSRAALTIVATNEDNRISCQRSSPKVVAALKHKASKTAR